MGKLIYWLLGILVTISIPIFSWLGNSIVQAKSDIAVLKAVQTNQYETITSVLKEIKEDVKAIRRGR